MSSRARWIPHSLPVVEALPRAYRSCRPPQPRASFTHHTIQSAGPAEAPVDELADDLFCLIVGAPPGYVQCCNRYAASPVAATSRAIGGPIVVAEQGILRV